MVGQKFPGANLIRQMLKQATAPLSKAIVKRVKKQPFLRRYILIQLGRYYYWCEDKLKFRGKLPIKRLDDDVRTMETGMELLLEVLIFGILGGLLLYEARRSAERSYRKEQRKEREFDDLETEKERLTQRIEDQVILTKRLKDAVAEYARLVGCTLPRDPEEASGEDDE